MAGYERGIMPRDCRNGAVLSRWLAAGTIFVDILFLAAFVLIMSRNPIQFMFGLSTSGRPRFLAAAAVERADGRAGHVRRSGMEGWALDPLGAYPLFIRRLGFGRISAGAFREWDVIIAVTRFFHGGRSRFYPPLNEKSAPLRALSVSERIYSDCIFFSTVSMEARASSGRASKPPRVSLREAM